MPEGTDPARFTDASGVLWWGATVGDRYFDGAREEEEGRGKIDSKEFWAIIPALK